MPSAPVAVVLRGIAGRMGREVVRALAEDADLHLTSGVERGGHPALGTCIAGVPVTADLRGCLGAGAVVVDFTVPEATREHARIAAESGAPFVSGTTGLSEEGLAALREAARRIPLLHAPNMSLGVALLSRLLREATRALPDYDVEILEMHHRHKVDAPSGTALRWAELIAAARTGLRCVHGRAGHTGERPRDEIGMHALRGGDVVGEHEVIFAGPGERVILAHRAESRAAFAGGVLAAVHFVATHAPGFYGMEDVLT